MGGHALGGAGGVLVERFDGEAARVEGDEHTTAAGTGGAQAAAFGDLGCVPHRARWEAAMEGQGCGQCGVGGAAGEDQVGAVSKSSGDRFVTHEADDVAATLERGGLQRAGRLERADPVVGQNLLKVLLVLLAVDAGHSEGAAAVSGDLGGDVVHPVNAGVGTRGATGTNHHRDPGFVRFREDGLQVTGHGGAGGLGGGGAEVVRTGVGGASVDRDDVGTELDAALNGGGGKPAAEHADRHQHPHRGVRGGLVDAGHEASLASGASTSTRVMSWRAPSAAGKVRSAVTISATWSGTRT